MIAGAKVKEKVSIRLRNNAIKIIEIAEIKTHGVEGYDLSLLNPVLTFYPYTNIISISKYNH